MDSHFLASTLIISWSSSDSYAYNIGYYYSHVIDEEAVLVVIDLEMDSLAHVSVSKVWEIKIYTIMG